MTKESKIVLSLISLFIVSIAVSVFHLASYPKEHRINKSLIPMSPAVGLVHIYGPISVGSTAPGFQKRGSDAIIQQLDTFKNDKRIKAIVIRINSPGGTVGASQEIFKKIKTVKMDRQIPVIVSVGDVAASGGYWISLAGDTIFANPGSLVGNIGVILSNLDLTQVPERYGIDMSVYKSAKHKDLLSSWRKATKSDDAIINALIADVHQQFVKTLETNRNIKTSDIARLTDGRIFTGRQALEFGLVDTLGGLDDAIALAKEKAGLPQNADVVTKSEFNLDELIQMWQRDFSSEIFSTIVNPGVLH